ncbi:SAM-dependent methyltransferase [[Acholeplasma] multilocale]|uniref:SAM-dependent methyltransferase n=1 Tax=[Acholeplasma] multilocale TaxID=264638 RepID=UPI00047A16CB|nr:SAM-dependent methyltransferase [[Acholeplasma] multilocale]
MKSNVLDQFYTNPIIANALVKKTFELFPSIKKYVFLEPSAGTGNFIESLILYGVPKNKIKAYDLEPKAKNNLGVKIHKKDYFDLVIKEKKMVTIGNPPFGVRGSLALDFLNKALNESDLVVMILPNIFNRYSVQSKVDKDAKLIFSQQLQEKSFILDDKSYGVKCVFQIWTKKINTYNKDLRIIDKPMIKHPDFDTWIHNNTKGTLKYFDKKKYGWDFAVVRQGFYDYGEKITNPKKLIQNRQYFFIKYNTPIAKEIIEQISFEKLSKTNTQVLGFSTSDFVKEYRILKGEIK